ncbi:MAG: glycoside hydrolase family protein [Saccharofermentanales bacterium]
MEFMFKPLTGKLWDHWIYRDPKTLIYHLYYLYIPENGEGDSWKVGHATSEDLKSFKEQKVVLEAGKKPGHWIDRHLATGSVIDFNGRYAMILTGHSTRFGEAPCLAWSDDLYSWTLDDCGPLVQPSDGRGELEGPNEWGRPDADCCGFCDPYVFRLDGDGTVYFILNVRVNEGEKQGRGRAALFSSNDLYAWKYEKILPSPHVFKRMETQQIIERNGKWYLIFSSWAHLINDDSKDAFTGKDHAAAFVLTADSMEGPYEFRGSTRLFPDISAYICKIIADPDGVDRVLTILMQNGETGISEAYKVRYPDEGGIEVLMDHR